MANEAKPAAAAVQKFQESTVELVLSKINSLKEIGGIALPKDYSAENSLRSAWLILQDAKTMDKSPVLTACTKDSIANSLFSMVTQGLSPLKRQCSFIPYGNKLTLQVEYAGRYALAKRYGGVKDIYAGVIYEGDVFEYAIDPKTGRKKIVKHEQVLANINEDKILGGYAVVEFEDGDTNAEIMTMAQVQKSWEMGQSKGKGAPHLNFRGEMLKKTVISRACKLLIAASDDSVLMESESDNRTVRARAEVSQSASTGPVVDIQEEEFTEAEVVEEPKAKEEPKPPAKKSAPASGNADDDMGKAPF